MMAQEVKSQAIRTDQVPSHQRAHAAQPDTSLFMVCGEALISRVLPSGQPAVLLLPLLYGQVRQAKWEKEPEHHFLVSFSKATEKYFPVSKTNTFFTLMKTRRKWIFFV